MPYRLTHSIHPNNETRLTVTKVRGVFLSLKERAALFLNEPDSEVVSLASSGLNPQPLTRHSLRIQNPNQNVLVNSHKRTKFGRSAVTKIYRAAGAMDRFDSVRSNYLFLTATLPGDTEESKWAIAEFAHEIIDGLKSWLSKKLLDRKEFYVWENQKRGALHFHYCLYCPDLEIQESIKSGFKAEMVRLYDGIEQKHSCNLWGHWDAIGFDAKIDILQARVETVYGSVGSYMAGYLGGKGGKHSNDSHHRYYPRRWFGVSRPLNTLVRSLTEESVQEFNSLGDAYENMARIREDVLDDALTHYDFSHKVGVGRTHVSYHTTETQLHLWQSRKMLNHTAQKTPIIWELTSSMRSLILNYRACSNAVSNSRVSLPPSCVLFLQDSTSLTLLNRGGLKKDWILIAAKLYSLCDWSSVSDRRIRRFATSLSRCMLLIAQYQDQMTWNQYGYLSNELDFVKWVDMESDSSYRGTTTEESGSLDGLLAPSGHVPRDADPSFLQLEI